MTRSSVLVRVSGLWLLVGVCAAVAWGDEGTESGVPPSVQIGGLATPAQVATPAGGVATPAVIKTRATLVAQQVRAGLLSWAQAWQQHRLGRDEVLELLGRAQVIEGSSRPEDKALRLQLGALLARDLQSVQDEEAAAHWHPRARLALSSYWVSVQDARAVELLERLWDERPLAQHSSFGFLVVEQWTHFYRDRGEHEKSAQTWMKLAQVEPRNAGQSWWRPDANWQAGRILWWAGDKAAAQELFDQAKSYNNSFFNGMMLYDQATFLLMDGKAEAAEKLLLAQLPAFTTPEDRVGPLWTLAQAQLQNQQFAQAKVSLTELTGYFQNPKNYKPNIGAEVIGTAADAKLQLLKKWENKAFDLPLTSVLARRDDEGVYHAKLYVHSLMPQDITVGFAPDFGAQLVKLEQLRSQRTDADVVVSLYDVAYQIVSHPNELKVRVSSKQAPSDQTQELRVRAPLPTE